MTKEENDHMSKQSFLIGYILGSINKILNSSASNDEKVDVLDAGFTRLHITFAFCTLSLPKRYEEPV